MVSIERVKRGAARFLDEEFTNKMTGWQKWVFGAAAGMYLENITTVAERLRSNELIKGLAIMDESGNVDVEKLYRHFYAEAQKGPVTFTVPVLGTVTMSGGDVEKLYRYIEEAGHERCRAYDGALPGRN